jgi:hypothetical protein
LHGLILFVDPSIEEGAEILSTRLLHRRANILGRHRPAEVLGGVASDARPERRITKTLAQFVEDVGAF